MKHLPLYFHCEAPLHLIYITNSNCGEWKLGNRHVIRVKGEDHRIHLVLSPDVTDEVGSGKDAQQESEEPEYSKAESLINDFGYNITYTRRVCEIQLTIN
jgi:hypothetical protein